MATTFGGASSRPRFITWRAAPAGRSRPSSATRCTAACWRNLIALRLLKQEVARRQLTASDAELAEAMKGMRQQFPTEAAFKQALTAQKMTLEQLREETRAQVLVSKMLQQEVGPQIAVKPTEIVASTKRTPTSSSSPRRCAPVTCS